MAARRGGMLASRAPRLFESPEPLEVFVELAFLVSVEPDLADGFLGGGLMKLGAALGFAVRVAEVFRAGEPITLELGEKAVVPGRCDLVGRRLAALRFAAED